MSTQTDRSGSERKYKDIDGIWWILFTGSMWTQLPEKYGKWNSIRICVMQQGATAVMAYRQNCVKVPGFDKDIYKERHKVENLFQKIKRYRRIAMRFEKLQMTFAAMVAIASILVWVKL